MKNGLGQLLCVKITEKTTKVTERELREGKNQVER